MVKPQGGSFTIYIDPVSPYSWFGFTNILRYRPLLNAHGVSVEILPFFLGGARDSVGNPWAPTPKSKEKFSKQDSDTTAELLGIKLTDPKVFPIPSLLAVRAATWVKDHYPADKFEATFLGLVSGYWGKGINVSKAEGIREALDGIFEPEELEKILENAVTPENKQRVIDQTMKPGAFGAPWLTAINSEGQRKDWWGNDRWDQVFAHLGVPYTPVSIIPPKSKL